MRFWWLKRCGRLRRSGSRLRSLADLLTRLPCRATSSRESWAGVERGGGLFSDLDAIDVVGGFSEASCGEVAIFFVVQDQSFSHGLREL